MTQYAVILITVPSEELASKIAGYLVENKLAACVNILPQIRSVYYWEGKVCDDKELLLVVKTKSSIFEDLKKAVTELHSYDVPEIILLPINNGNKEYLQWIDDNIVVK
jgi:periplasmic divalent cation tolerance protein